MFGKLAADALGLSDIGSVITSADYDKVDSDDYVMHEDQEKIFFLIKSKSDEYCFTNKALVHLDGTSAASKKRMLRRYTYSANPVSHVMLETAGNIDMDVEIKFRLGARDFSIDVHKKHLEQVKDLYKALFRISELMHENEVSLSHAKTSLEVASTTLGRGQAGATPIVESFKELNQAAFAWLAGAQQKYWVKDFGFVFERYIKA
ncbi:PH domain-containing protein [Myxococcus sp. CA051A]|uniref:Bacterial Pleckstrin homology domain-containing protein n=1 Tax=Myxococcus llanfairpwllgwyngyllgogerychwyrndrobwllllantysiliogogogochensis TaxID=2590453 RepID=A0A540WX95_9BACT|nr:MULTISPECIES: PH domain-containing protein [Myxococcus]NTX07739.1 PH domain-containing protein [Myxococcus sp. CA040A]NTX15973.1 PH domain-containing protein [Myxococcus sp. CA056]NTX41036.1 PH domain-containing protein [Myxococcus sp. CA033]NTX56274.1 PH domain-containing protein [Myxococcus sp. CA039A]NTX67483.1 PH domain-containing protein [Myxococcus sp. CA051A]